jgi:alpha-glucosidase (family GH31 glycosyl hydrolase)
MRISELIGRNFYGRLVLIGIFLFSSAEFLLGDDLLAAPVLEPGAVSRDVYLPSGQWRDEADPLHPIYTGPLWLRNYPAALDTLPYFTRVKPWAN